jgi:hypothetical protein
MIKLRKYLGLFLLLFCLNVVSAAIEISKSPVNDIVVSEIGEPAIFNLQIKNLGNPDSFEVYTLVSGIDISPKESLYLASGEAKNVTIKVYFDKRVLKDRETLSFEYRVTGQQTGVTKEILSIKAYNFETALSILAENIKRNQKETKISVKNRINYAFNNLEFKASSEFFEDSFKLNLKPLEEKTFTASLNQEKLSRAVGGSYILSSTLTLGNSSGKVMSIFNFEEKTDIRKEEKTSGFFIRKFSSRNINQGTMPAMARVSVKRDWFTRILTSSNIKPSDTKREGLSTILVFEKELQPGEELYVQVKTNYLFPLILLILIVGGVWAFIYYVFKRRSLVIKKRVAMVKTKKGEFALKVTLYIKALKNVEKVSVMDNIPALVKLYDKFGILRPNRIDEVNRRVEWDFEALSQDEERVISYVIYSKLGVFGRFDLPEAAAVYEEGNEIYETESNKVILYFDEGREEY